MTVPIDPHVRHPRETELADYIDRRLPEEGSKDVSLHLEMCRVCSDVLDRVATDVPATTAGQAAAATASVSVTGPSLPQVLQDALDAGYAGSPGAGQLWRLRGPAFDGGEVTALAAIVKTGEDSVLVVPVTPDAAEATDLWTVQLPVSDSAVEMAFWTSVATFVGYEVLDVQVGWTSLPPLLELLRAQQAGAEPPDGLRLGRQLDTELASYRADLLVEFAQLQEARLVADDTGPENSQGDALDVVDAMLAAKWTPTRLKAVAGNLTAGAARAVLDRRHQLTTEQLKCVGAALGLAVTAGGTSVDWRWVRLVADPAMRKRFEATAAELGEDPWTFRGQEATRQHLQAARKSEGSWEDLRQLLEDRLQALEAESLRPRR